MSYYYNYKTGVRKPRRVRNAAFATVCLVFLLTLSFAIARPQEAKRTASRLPATKKRLHLPRMQKAKTLPPPTSGQNSASSAAAGGPSFGHLNITTTYFWAGEDADSSNGFISNSPSAWDEHWTQHYGGVDTPQRRNGYLPAGFTPKENPFYFALPYNDIDASGRRKASATKCQAYSQSKNPSYSWCKNDWIAIRHGGKVVYAQWEDVGPFYEDDEAYVFGSSAPKNSRGEKAGLDVSPAVKDYLGLGDVDRADWSFVTFGSVPSGPWKQIITSSLGDSL